MSLILPQAAAIHKAKASGSAGATEVARRGNAMPEPSPDLPPGHYRHFKGGLYEVLGVARHSESEEELVVYRALYGEHGLWVRPKAAFLGKVLIAGREIPRFHYVGSAAE
jgi:Protein of unknown function (DUF1653)